MAKQQRGRKGKFERDADSAARDAEACRLRAQNHTYPEIAEKLGYADRGHAHQAVQRAMQDIVREPAEDVRAMELERLDTLASTTQHVIHTSDDNDTVLKAVDRHLKIQTRRAALLGLDAPTKAEHSGPQGSPLRVDVTEYTPEQMRRHAEQVAAEVNRAYEPTDEGAGAHGR